ncbi:oxygen-evolving enhancer protein 3 [Hibiscus syriacus]|uniref:Oxygen-evolving enhancer protein 3 n=1 Tax=Hibiscus syriacus TaxID=106335 RepID=A0A6A2YPC9_HIBSY|nr:GLABROUS1 enhancer-binding protein-like [Hibiscus syriacus]KAE8681142.1 oxygen-evolving enhancer protein 3 [Hibiscus syriacus]
MPTFFNFMAKKSSKDPIDDPPTASSSSSSSSEDTSTQTPQSQKNSTLNVKPVATKPMEGTSKAKKPRSKPSSSPVKPASMKRPSVSEQEQTKELKRSRKKAGEEGSGSVDAVEEEEENKTGEDEKKQLFQRLFSDDDEIAVLKGLLDFLATKGVDPFADTNAFHDFVKGSIHADVSKAQLMYKVRRLRKKLENNARRSKDGEDRTFSKPHEQKSFELSKRIWGKEGIIRKIDTSAAKPKGNGKALDALKAEPVASADEKVDDGEPMEVDIKWPKSSGSLFDKKSGVGSLEDEVLKQGLDMVGEEKRASLKEKWRRLQIAELELFLERNELVMEQAKWMLEFYKSQEA